MNNKELIAKLELVQKQYDAVIGDLPNIALAAIQGNVLFVMDTYTVLDKDGHPAEPEEVWEACKDCFLKEYIENIDQGLRGPQLVR